ncbi:PqiC family protein [Chitinimonas koreensis]|uniref:PqiC family protein n=1 Tax=Chitinimonas koreensis TaxID=356302 RepID=UPI0016545C9A|nr:PqiC family protein [Chitinimonas koreensis]QNM98430.1 membrane integrity-associated transporter subunit PqiC [Chitinimonas koreensis]
MQPPALQRVALGPLTLPESLRRPQLVMRLGERLEVYEQRRWIQPLDAEIADALAERLGRRLAAPVATLRQAAAAGATRRIALDVRRFESTPAMASLDVLWSIADGLGKRLADGRTEARQPCADGGEAALIAAHGANLDRLAAELAQALATLPAE